MVCADCLAKNSQFQEGRVIGRHQENVKIAGIGFNAFLKPEGVVLNHLM